jgi:hypothetical protein
MKSEKSLRKFWLIEGRDGQSEAYYKAAYRVHLFSENQMSALLQAMAAKSSLNYSEIALALCRTNLRSSHLEVQRHYPPFALSCGPGMEWTARILVEDDPRLEGVIRPPWPLGNA